MKPMIRILVIEDERNILNFITSVLESQDYQVIPASNAVEGLSQAASSSPDLILLDLGLPDLDGTEVIQKIRTWSAVPILVISARTQEQDKVLALDLGADDYITKPFSMVLLGRRVTALLRRSGQTVTPDIMTFGDVTVDFSGYTAKGPEGKIDITPKEIDLLKLLVEHKGLVLTRSQMLDSLWGADYPIIDRIIDTYIKNLRKKLRLDCIVTVKGIGYKFEVET